ncbi:MAG: hypothetical protein COT74_10570 [Bdellovibrionales bacterium CG10_big_fil_rev_8_21_14_0_10_45_34]|nr:MAG: hypothetical protein COT74_10570 [Bdellovibrionales bacterium CG10_big_fil_rev_8_21_14_0_10_45_34]
MCWLVSRSKYRELEDKLKSVQEKNKILNMDSQMSKFRFERTEDTYYMSYKSENFLKFNLIDKQLHIKKIEKTDLMKSERIYSSDIYISLILNLDIDSVHSDEYISHDADKMWNRIEAEIQRNYASRLRLDKTPRNGKPDLRVICKL